MLLIRLLTPSSAKTKLPIYTLQIVNKKTYVVNSPDLIQAVDRAAKTLTFHPFIAMILPRLFDADKATMEIVNRNLDLKEGPWSLSHDISESMHRAMMPGPDLDRMTKVMLTKFLPSINALEGATGSIELFQWARRAFSIASTEAIYGPGNPFSARPDLEEAFW